MASPAILPKVVGSHWIWMYKGKEWPVVLCGDDIPPKPPSNRTGPTRTTLIESSHWVIEDRLVEYEPTKNYLVDVERDNTDEVLKPDDDAIEAENQRRIAFDQDARELQSALYWQNFIINRGAVRRMERDQSGKASRREKRKRDDEGTGITGGSPGSSLRSPRQRSAAHHGSQSKRRRQLPTPGATLLKKETKTTLSSATPSHAGVHGVVKTEPNDEDGLFVSEEDPFVKEELGLELQEFRERHGVYTIFVGNSKVPFQTTRDAVTQSQILSDRTEFTEALGTHVNISDIPEVTARDFVLVGEYLQHSEFTPHLIEKRGAIPRLNGLFLSEERDAAAERCARVFRTASHLQLAGLQSLCVNKLRVLYPLSPLHILIVARIFVRSVNWGCEAKTEFMDWLVDHMAEYYWLLTKEHGGLLVDVLEDSDEIKRRVLESISADLKIGRRGLDEE
ncbi:hypothetical protein B0A55_10595 [Friedmanniomyces simplex]|uniref:Uncharacterized protein n=1 Tax=Friedmanniomyces simplex TaxID=329884 RepID=A0A4U0WJH6_9PEZI|nr:hypothetical protein B0A55_10595 [Friedmanniomyces simplex]